MPRTIGAVALFLALNGCSERQGTSFDVFGSLHEMMTSGAPAVATLDKVSGRGTFGVGALSELRGEVTIVDGQIWLGYPALPSGSVVVADSSNERVALLVIARPSRWFEATSERDVAPAALEDYLVELVSRSGLDTTRPIVIRAEGGLRDIEWHIVDGSRIPGGASDHAVHAAAGIRRQAGVLKGALVGFFATSQEGIVTHRGTRTHLHLVATEVEQVTGHVDAVGLARGVQVRLGQ